MVKCLSKDCPNEGTVVVEGEFLCPSCFNLAHQLADIIERENQGSVRYSLAAIKGIGKDLARSIASERVTNGAYRSLGDFAVRVPGLNKRTVEALAKAGAFDSLEPNRAAIVESVGGLLAFGKRAREDEDKGAENLFGS